MGALSAAVAAGKVRHVGLSNETAWGLTKFCQLGTEWCCATNSTSTKVCSTPPSTLHLQANYSDGAHFCPGTLLCYLLS